jgi:hypothetical protein
MSDIKAAVDTAYLLLRSEEEREELGKLSMTCFKARLAQGRNFGMEFKKHRGFIASDAFKPTRTTTEIVTEILEANPNSNQTEVVRLGKAEGAGKRQIEDCLRTGPWQITRGAKNSLVYSLEAREVGENESRT